MFPIIRHRSMEIHRMKIEDVKAKRDFEELFGMEIDGDCVLIPHDIYVRNAKKIHAIQMMSAFRLKDW